MVQEPREAHPQTSTFTLTASTPRRIDLATVKQDSPTPLHTQGLYELQGDVLTYCIGAPNQPRPDGFATTPGDERTLVVLTRVPH